MADSMDKPALPTWGFQPGYGGAGRHVLDGGLTKREYAAIHLRVPKSGDPEIDDMIREARRLDAAEAALSGREWKPNQYQTDDQLVATCTEWAERKIDAMLAAASVQQPYTPAVDGAKVWKIRKRHCMPQSALAGAVGVHSTTIGRIEKGLIPGDRFAKALANALGVTVEDLLAARKGES